jgi:hypothetical protein
VILLISIFVVTFIDCFASVVVVVVDYFSAVVVVVDYFSYFAVADSDCLDSFLKEAIHYLHFHS